MKDDLCRGWREPDLVEAWERSSELMRLVLISLATSDGHSTIYDIAEDIGRSRLQIQGALSMWSQNVTVPMGIRDANGNDSWPWTWDTDTERDLAVYCMPEPVAQVIRRLSGG